MLTKLWPYGFFSPWTKGFEMMYHENLTNSTLEPIDLGSLTEYLLRLVYLTKILKPQFFPSGFSISKSLSFIYPINWTFSQNSVLR